MVDFPKLTSELIKEGTKGYKQFIADNYEVYQKEKYIFDELGRTIRNQQYFTIDQVAIILNWRQPTRPGYLQQNDKERVKLISKEALAQDDDEIKTHILTLIKGIAIPSATRILTVTYPEQYPTLNRLNWKILKNWNYLDYHYGTTPSRWIHYLKSSRSIMNKYNITGRELDQILIATYLKYGLDLNLQNFVPLDTFF